MSTEPPGKDPPTDVSWASVYGGKGYMGLANLGNTCFMNACLQVLNHTYELNECLQEKHIGLGHRKPETILLQNWVELQEMMWSKPHGAVSPNKFVQSVQELARIKDREIFTGWAQNDMPEFLLFFMDCLHNSLSRRIHMRITGKEKTRTDKIATDCYQMLKVVYEKEYSEIMELFYGIYVSDIRSLGGTVSYTHKPEMFFILDLPLPDPRTYTKDTAMTLYDCFDVFTQAEPLTGENAWFNEATQAKEDVVKCITFWNLPPVLVITLKRFHALGRHKRQDCVEFPLEGLDLSKYVSGYQPHTYVYDLYGVCNHTGGVMGGHYTAFVRNAQQEWIHFNDITCKVLSPSQVETDIVTPMAYCLFYRIRRR